MYPILWQGKTLTLAALSAGIKQAFVAWLKPHYLNNARELLPPGEYVIERQAVVAGAIFWTTAMSAHVAGAISSREGEQQLARLLLGEQAKGWTEAELEAFLDAKNSAPNPIAETWKLIMEEADPEKKPTTAPGLTPTAISSTNTATPTSLAPSAENPSTAVELKPTT